MPSVDEVYEAVSSEIKYQEKWDKEREADTGLNSYMDKDKSVETWILWMEEYLARARSTATNSFDKSGPLENIRKVTALAVTCMKHHGAPKRFEI